MNIFELFPKTQFMDYTKISGRVLLDMPNNYDLTLSYSESNSEFCREYLNNRGKVAVVFNIGNKRKIDLADFPTTFMDFRVKNGDEDDLRFLDRHVNGLVVGLKAKGDAFLDKTGFVIHKGHKEIRDSQQFKLSDPSETRQKIKSVANKITKKVVSLDIDSEVEKFIESKKTLLTDGRLNPKTAKSEEKGWHSVILHLAPAYESGFNLCPFHTIGCAEACLMTAGGNHLLGGKINARIIKSWVFIKQRKWFMKKLCQEIDKLNNKHKKLSVRLNGTSDVMWEKINCT